MVLQKPILRNQTVVLYARPEVHVEEAPVVDQTEEVSIEAPIVEDTADEGVTETEEIEEVQE